jgi:hypothetical protein
LRLICSNNSTGTLPDRLAMPHAIVGTQPEDYRPVITCCNVEWNSHRVIDLLISNPEVVRRLQAFLEGTWFHEISVT